MRCFVWDDVSLGRGYSGSLWSRNYDFSLLRLNADGTLDTSFSDNGKAALDINGSGDFGYSVTLQPNGKIVVAGSSFNGNNNDFSLVRLNADGTLDSTVGTAARGTTPTGSTLGGTINYIEGAAAVVLDGDAAVYDAELAALGGGMGNYSGASITLSRLGGASMQDRFSALGLLSFSNGSAMLAGTAVGTVSNAAGQLSITFNANATQQPVNEVLRSIGYVNASDAPPASAVLNWLFRDGNDGTPLAITDTTTVRVQNVNDAPTGGLTINGTAMLGQMLRATNTLADADGLSVVSYQWLRGSTLITGATGSSYELTQADVGQQRRYVPLGGGTVEGPDLNGTLVPGGVDWQVQRKDGVLEIAAHYVLRLADGSLVEVQSNGLRHGPPQVMARLARGEAVGSREYFFRTLVRFTTGAPAWAHLNKVMAIAVGQREARRVVLDLYRIS